MISLIRKDLRGAFAVCFAPIRYNQGERAKLSRASSLGSGCKPTKKLRPAAIRMQNSQKRGAV